MKYFATQAVVFQHKLLELLFAFGVSSVALDWWVGTLKWATEQFSMGQDPFINNKSFNIYYIYCESVETPPEFVKITFIELF